MTSSNTSPATSVLQELYLGRVRWDLLIPFPEQDPSDRLVGDRTIAVLADLLHRRIDPEALDAGGRFPDGFITELQDAGLLRLMIDADLGGLGLSWLNACRVVEAAASWSMPVAFTLAIQNGFGSGSYLPALPPGPLRRLITDRVAEGILSGGADAEVAGAANRTRTTVAVPVDGGTAYLLSGEKVFIGNGAMADFLDVSATLVDDDGTESVRLFFVDTRTPGFEVVMTHEFMGLRGAPLGMLRLNEVRVPASQLMPESIGQTWRMRPAQSADSVPSAPDSDSEQSAPLADLGRLAILGRHLVIAPPSLAVARLSLLWSRDFVSRRSIDGRSLAEYEEIRRCVSENIADTFTIESIQLWCLLGEDRADTGPELTAAKNLTSMAAWRSIDRTMSLLGGEGYETARSKAARGARPLPVERCFRDARALRVAGGVDVMMDRWSAESNLTKCYYADGGPAFEAMAVPGEIPAQNAGIDWPREELTEHQKFVDANAVRLATVCRELTSAPQAQIFARQRTIALIGRIAGELLGMAVVLARSATLAATGQNTALDLGDAACTGARRRVEGLWAELAMETTPITNATSDVSVNLEVNAGSPTRTGDAWLNGTGLDFLAGDVLDSLVPDRSALGTAAPAPVSDAVSRVVRDEIEVVVAAVWCDLFEVEDINRDDDFFELGGHSMIAVRMASRLRDDLGLRVPVRAILENPTVASLAHLLAQVS